MKIIRRVIVGLGLLAAAYALLLLFLAGDVVTTKYASLADAREHNLVARGWLPDILPASSRDITTSNNLDLNTSVGKFSFAPADYASFKSKTKPYNIGTKNPFDGLDDELEGKKKNGFLVSMYQEEKSMWVFSCRPVSGHCEYIMWLERG